MITGILITICALICLYRCYRYAFARPAGFPPGPPRLPFFGSYLFMMLSNFKYLHKGVLNFSKWYKSDIVGFHHGPFPVVAVHSAEGIREVLNNSDFDGRPPIYLAKMRDPRTAISGIFFQDGPVWKEQRRFVLRYLRDFGFGRRFEDLELIIQQEITDMLDLIRNGPRFEHEKQLVKPGGYRVMLPNIFSPCSANSMFHIMLNERIPRVEQADLIKLIQNAMMWGRVTDDYGKMLSIMPWIRHVFPNWSAYNKIVEANEIIYKFAASYVDRHLKTYDESCERNFLDLYIKEIKQQESEVKDGRQSETSFNREEFIMSMVDFSFPALAANSTQLSLLIQHLMLNPKVIKRVQREIDEVVGSGRLPTLEDRKNLHYTEATIREGMRIETLVPSDLPHLAMVDTQLMGYQIAKGTVVFPGLYALHTDERIWGDPKNFRPERFLDDNGKLSLKKDVSLPFGAGKRLCAGETFARNMMFLMTTAICQNFNFVLGPGDKLPDVSKNLSGIFITPPDFWLQLEDRK